MNIREADRLSLTVIMDNYYDPSAPAPSFAVRHRAAPGTSFYAEHGFSCYAEVTVDGVTRGFMFDYGPDFPGIINNMNCLNIDVRKVAALGLSHGHFDHWGGLVGFLRHNAAKIEKGTPLYVGAEAFARRYSIRPMDPEPRDIGQLTEHVDRLGIAKVIEVSSLTEVIPGGYLTGNIARVTDYEKGSPSLLVERGGGLTHDQFPGEQAFVCNVRGKGLVILSGCAHAGIVNTVRHTRQVTGVRKVHAVAGGFHLINSSPAVIARTIADLSEIDPDYVIPAHCTGFEATGLFAREMGNRFILNTVGTRYTFDGQP